MVKTTIELQGMHCRSCEILIEQKLKQLPNIERVEVDYRSGKTTLHSSAEPDMDKIKLLVEEAGYALGHAGEQPILANDSAIYKDLLTNFLILVLLYLILKQFGLLDLGGKISQNPSGFAAVILIGLTAGFSTCMALVGGLILGASSRFAEQHPDATARQKFLPHLFFNFGRIVSYTILGGAIGALGSVFQLSGTVTGVLVIVVGLTMLWLGLQLTEVFPGLDSGTLTLPKSVSKFLGISHHQQKEYSHTNAFLLGALTFFLPCGFTQAMQLYAVSTGNFFSGAIIMGLFALGTAPGLLGVGGLTSILKGTAAKKFFRFVGLAVAVLALFNISNGYNLTGWNLGVNRASANTIENAATNRNIKTENGLQIVRMDQLVGGYSPNSFTIKQGIPTRWIINSKAPNSCAASIISTQLGIKRLLQAGENTIDFVPKISGRVKFSCSMGMYVGYFNILANNDVNQKSIDGLFADSSDSGDAEPGNDPYKNATILRASYTYDTDITPKEFIAAVGVPTILEIDVKEDGAGCMGSIVLPGLNNEIEYLRKGEKLALKFTATKPGVYDIACGMGSPRGQITVK